MSLMPYVEIPGEAPAAVVDPDNVTAKEVLESIRFCHITNKRSFEAFIDAPIDVLVDAEVEKLKRVYAYGKLYKLFKATDVTDHAQSQAKDSSQATTTQRPLPAGETGGLGLGRSTHHLSPTQQQLVTAAIDSAIAPLIVSTTAMQEQLRRITERQRVLEVVVANSSKRAINSTKQFAPGPLQPLLREVPGVNFGELPPPGSVPFPKTYLQEPLSGQEIDLLASFYGVGFTGGTIGDRRLAFGRFIGLGDDGYVMVPGSADDGGEEKEGTDGDDVNKPEENTDDEEFAHRML